MILSVIGFILIFSLVASVIVDRELDEDGKEIIRQITTSLIAIVAMIIGGNYIKE
jgi:cell division protein FtsW (lipid II flippase)